MRCPTCGAVTRVLETRATDTHATRRQRLCDNMHRFDTFEVVGPAVNPGALRRAEATVRANIARWQRDRAIRLDPRPPAVVGPEYGLSVRRVEAIRGGTRRSGEKRLTRARQVAHN
jgi:hypothetical protein